MMARLGLRSLQKRGCISVVLRRVIYVIPFMVFIVAVLGLYKSLTSNDASSLSTENGLDLQLARVKKISSNRSRWAVISVQDMSENLFNDLAERFQNWFLMIVITSSNASNFQRSDHRSEICTESQLNQRYNLTGLLPIAKAYMHAVVHGAQWIYTHSAVNSDSLQYIYPPAIYSTGRRLVLEDVSGLFDARAHFGCRNGESTRRGNSSLQKYSLSTNTNSTYIHASASYYTTTYRPTTAYDTTSPTQLMCDYMSPPVSLSSQLFADISLDGITFNRNAFWALPVTGIFPKRWMRAVQWLAWMTGGRLTIDRVSREFTNQIPDKSLTRFSCNRDPSLAGCVRSLLLSVLPHKLDFHYSVNRWLDALNTADYEFPKLNQMSYVEIASPNSRVLYEPLTRSTKYVDTQRERLWLPVVNRDASLKLYEKTCRLDEFLDDTVINKPRGEEDVPKIVDLSEHPWTQFSRVVLVIVFNTPIYFVIPYLEILYRPFFPYIVYCGPVLLDDLSLLSDYELNFVVYPSSPVEHQPGSFNYECVGLAARLFNPNAVEGFLVTSDDLLVLVPKIVDAPRDVVWFLSEDEIRIGELRTLRECRLGMCDYHPHWHWWYDYAPATMRALNSLRATRDDDNDPLFLRCHRNLIRHNGAEMRANGGFSDVYYIPQAAVEDFSKLASFFVEHLIFLEIAVPTIIRCLVEPRQIWGRLTGLQIWTVEHRDEPWRYFNKALLYGKMFLHPTKWSGMAGNVGSGNSSVTRRENETVALVNVYCRRILPYMHDPLARLPV